MLLLQGRYIVVALVHGHATLDTFHVRHEECERQNLNVNSLLMQLVFWHANNCQKRGMQI